MRPNNEPVTNLARPMQRGVTLLVHHIHVRVVLCESPGRSSTATLQVQLGLYLRMKLRHECHQRQRYPWWSAHAGSHGEGRHECARAHWLALCAAALSLHIARRCSVEIYLYSCRPGPQLECESNYPL